ncbi:DUF7576 family protein [Salinilacihabitans rarus]|nr:hypothetical protein [Salinilacihabitans rarus]
MRCDNCGAEAEIAYTLTTYVRDTADERVSLHFCSADCLQVWT